MLQSMNRFTTLLKKSIRYIKNFGLIEFFKKAKDYIKSKLKKKQDNLEYSKLISIEKFNKNSIKKEINDFKYKPLISVVIPTYKTPIKYLNEAIKSVENQFYDNFEIIVYDDGSRDLDLENYLKRLSAKKLKVFFSKKNWGISKITNLAVSKSEGEYIVFLDHDDTLSPNALYEVLKIINKNKNVDYIYSDEDKLSEKGEREDPFFKPDFSYDLLLSCMYITHIRVIKKTTFEKLNGLDSSYDGAQDWDFALRLYEKKGNFFHIPKILYHWRKSASSTASENSNAKNYAYQRQKKLLEDHLKRIKVNATVKDGLWKGSYKIDYTISGNPKVQIIIPFKDKVEYLRDCIDSIKRKTTYKNYEICIVNNQSVKDETKKYISGLKDVVVLNYNKSFNFSLINNFAVKRTQSDYIIFLNNDTKIITPNWIENMLSLAQRKDTGAVGGLLLYKDNTVQHAGIIVGLGGVAAHSHRGFDSHSNGHGGLLTAIRDVSAVTAACMMVERSKFLKIKGFDENLKIAYNDVDLCLRLLNLGYRSVYTPYVKLYHYESKTRKKTVGENDHDTGIFLKKWKHYIKKGDPFYNINLTHSKEDYSFRKI